MNHWSGRFTNMLLRLISMPWLPIPERWADRHEAFIERHWYHGEEG